ncbi:hypothetical protein A3F28_01910 [Candidatus Uhrbacteria bacterium RIFCSPHIGHO2_12_FULL_57_11]|uniref:Uncharacterized protein n=2 Tax=Candidatus Uhriibacteriota TaxID=1752732 RepID=A0A1F7UHY8_9BACT|nr:MAG: hypothetical protein A3D72_02190 [Candidatus Uhrbacteria bacterium RIFCSPHIGHO2_02_FULL_57_19]OGL77307.1 MAG: hypothetical protein A3F28_01910 [Candidatus Uhrbacteria bacterium RIFCSPHIGHO2_12_FULL_57_11]
MGKADFRRFYETHLPKIYRFVFFRVAGNRHQAEDLTSEIFIKALEHFDSYDERRSKSSWIFTIARNHLANYYRSAGRVVTDEDFESLPVAADDLEERFAAGEEEEMLIRGIGKLRPKEAELVRMKYLDELSYEEMAGVLGRDKGALKVATFRAMQQLREVMRPYAPAIEPRTRDDDQQV